MRHITNILVAAIIIKSLIDIFRYMFAKKSFGQASHRIKTAEVIIGFWAGMLWFFVAAITLFGEGLYDYHHVFLNFVIGLSFLIMAKMKCIELNSECLFFSNQIVYWKQIKSVEIKRIYIGYLITLICNNDIQQIINIRCFSKSKSFFAECLRLNKIQFSETVEKN